VIAPRRRHMLEGYLFAAPWLVGFLTFTAGAMLYSVWMSLQRWNILTPPHFVGLGNYQKAFLRDPLFWKCLFNTAYYSSLSVPLRLLIALGLAVLLNQQVRGLALFRTLFYLPSVVTGVATAMLWMLLLNPDVGGVNYVLRRLGVFAGAFRLDTASAVAADVDIPTSEVADSVANLVSKSPSSRACRACRKSCKMRRRWTARAPGTASVT